MGGIVCYCTWKDFAFRGCLWAESNYRNTLSQCTLLSLITKMPIEFNKIESILQKCR